MVRRDEVGFQFLIIGLMLTVSAYGFSFILTTSTDFCIVNGIRDLPDMTKLEGCITKTSDSSIMTYYIGFAGIILLAISSFLLSNLSFKKSKNKNNKIQTCKKVKDYSKIWHDFQYFFWPTMIVLTISFVNAIQNENTTIGSKIADTFGVLGFFFAIYVAIWALGTEQRRRNHEKEENRYYKININDMVSNLAIIFSRIFKQVDVLNMDATQRTQVYETRIGNLEINKESISKICDEIQILNLNPYVPADVKDHVYVIMVQSKKVISRTPRIDNIVGYESIVDSILLRIQKLYETEYMKNVDELRGEFGSDILPNLPP